MKGNMERGEEEEGIKNFTVAFFKNMKCEIVDSGKMVVVKNVPPDFEKFVGKKAPYNLVFNKEDEKDDYELMNKGNFILKAMSHYLDGRGQTTLLKLKFDVNFDDLLKNNFLFKNSKPINVNKTNMYEFVVRFTFLTTLQYLNEKEQVMNSICLRDGKIIDFDLGKYSAIEGKKEEISIEEVNEYYNLAKSNLKIMLEKRIEDVGSALEVRLDKERKRVEEHFAKQIQEIENTLIRQKKQIDELEGQKGKDGADIKNIDLKIAKIRESIEKYNFQGEKAKIEKERDFFIKDEEHKHSLNIDNKLLNTTIIYYPVYKFNFILRVGDIGSKQIELEYNPFRNTLGSIGCESCQQKMKEITLCSSGHIACNNCLERCRECGRDSCTLCRMRLCDICARKLCKRCIDKCPGCWKSVCNGHIRKDSSGKGGCVSCLKTCSSCRGFVARDKAKSCPSCHQEYCESCAKSVMKSVNGKNMCSQCTKQCSICKKILGRDNFGRSMLCKCPSCSDSSRCAGCKKQLCSGNRRF